MHHRGSPLGRRHQSTNPEGCPYNHEYDVTAYDNHLRETVRHISGTSPLTFQYDQDSLLAAINGLTIKRDPSNGLMLRNSLQTVSETYTYNAFGEVIGHEVSAAGANIYTENYTRDQLGRVTELIETVEGESTAWRYLYDAAGRLEEVRKEGTLYERYAYDTNGNRISITTSNETITAVVDDQDRVQRQGDVTFTYTADGSVSSKNENGEATLYNYDATGQLLGVSLPNGREVSYSFDALNRRAAKAVDGEVVKKWLYGKDDLPIAELDANGNLVATFHGPLMVTEDRTFRLIRDQLGSIRLVVNASTGEVVQRLSYDPWGKTIEDTNPGLQPFGFAGGMNDPDTAQTRFGRRDYEPTVARFLTRDTIRFEGGLNLYAYANNDPVNFVDPTGLSGIPPWAFSTVEFTQTVDVFKSAHDWSRWQTWFSGKGGTVPGNYEVRYMKDFLLNKRQVGRGLLGGKTPFGVATAEAIVIPVAGTSVFLLAYGNVANMLCQQAIARFQEVQEQFGVRCSSSARKTEAYLDMISKCNAPGVFKGARDYANSL